MDHSCYSILTIRVRRIIKMLNERIEKVNVLFYVFIFLFIIIDIPNTCHRNDVHTNLK